MEAKVEFHLNDSVLCFRCAVLAIIGHRELVKTCEVKVDLHENTHGWFYYVKCDRCDRPL